MHVDFKITTWERVEIPEEIEQEVLKAIESGEITSANELFEKFDKTDNRLSCDIILDVSEQMEIEENGFCSTIELYSDDDSTPIWKNGQEDSME